MKATEAKFLDFLKKSPQFIIPIYQRTYSWTQPQCQQLWDDILRTGSNDDIAAHFVGSIVYIEKGLYQVSSQSPLLVIDGQQRLTTVSLILEALARRIGDTEPLEGFSAKKLRNYYLLNPLEEDERGYKLLLTQTDKQSLLALVSQKDLPADHSLRINESFEFFSEHINRLGDDLIPLCKGLAKLVVVDISLNRDQDNPQLIFESMNSTGKELSQADLIRNYILMGLEPSHQTRLYEDHWRPMEVAFGQEAYGEEFDAFMRHFLTVRTGNIPRQHAVYEAFKSYAKRDYHIITATKRLVQVAKDFVHHYSTAWESGKAMLVCIDKVTCVRMYNLIKKYWDERIAKLEAKLPSITDEQEVIFRQRQIAWMRETRAAVVVSEEQGEVDKFRKWELDITPHRRLIKEGIDLPESMRSKPEFRNMQRMELDDAFKEDEHPFRIAIVCAMWLTGFNVPSLSTLYLDKPLKAHTLMQAIARANRVYEGKNNGMVVDYCGILKHLRKALATFAGTRGAGGGPDAEMDPAKPEEDLLADLAEAIALVRSFLDEHNASLDDVIQKTGFDRNAAIVACKEAANENDRSRKRFEVMCRQVFQKFKACINVPGVNEHRSDRDAINIIYKSLQKDRDEADITDIIRQLHEVVDVTIETLDDIVAEEREPYDISRIDFDRLKQEFERSPRKNTTVQNLREAVETRLQRLLQQNPLRTDFQKHYEDIVAEYNREKDRVTIEATFEALLRLVKALDDEESRAVAEGLDEESLAIFDLLKKETLTSADTKKVKEVAVELLEKLKAEKLRIDQWRQKEATRDAVRLAIHDFLWSDDTGLPVDSYEEPEVKERAEEVYRHVYRVYPRIPSPFYEKVPA